MKTSNAQAAATTAFVDATAGMMCLTTPWAKRYVTPRIPVCTKESDITVDQKALSLRVDQPLQNFLNKKIKTFQAMQRLSDCRQEAKMQRSIYHVRWLAAEPSRRSRKSCDKKGKKNKNRQLSGIQNREGGLEGLKGEVLWTGRKL